MIDKISLSCNMKENITQNSVKYNINFLNFSGSLKSHLFFFLFLLHTKYDYSDDSESLDEKVSYSQASSLLLKNLCLLSYD